MIFSYILLFNIPCLMLHTHGNTTPVASPIQPVTRVHPAWSVLDTVQKEIDGESMSPFRAKH